MNAVPAPAASAPSDLLRQLDDIKGLAPVSAWPLAPGWWAVIGITVVLIAVIGWLLARRCARRRRWQFDAARQLDSLERGLTNTTAQATLSDLSALLRRIAIRRFSRSQCAGLEGGQWLAWLQAHDPARFDWPGKGRLLVDAPYARPGTDYDTNAVTGLLRAAKAWVA